MSGRAFLDTNVLVYCFDGGEPAKQRRAQQVVESSDDELVVSTQVLQEFYVTVVRKLSRPLAEADAEHAVRELSALPTVAIDAALVLAAIATSRQHRLSLWDALVLRSACAGGCARLLSEDLQHGFQLEGVRVENPFLDLR
ncbi:MAG: hypothetical protein A2138_02570 [Deltaproteobacteria bacterium RBG_16_71_12]|nr:MAG: hypothetical protein A2138_02570 [Deltaproteobacteria bacterium RBG_16_71_12]